MSPNPERALVLVALIAAACAGPAAEGGEDFAEWRLSEQPAISIGVADGDERYTFHFVTGLHLTPDGGVIVAEDGGHLRLYDAAGTYVRTVGRPGQGPGEFGLVIIPFPYRGDSLAVFDFLQSRLTIFDAAGGLGRMVLVTAGHVSPPGTIPDQSCCMVEHAFADGSFVLELPADIPIGPGPPRHTLTTLVRLGPDGAVLDTLGAFPGGRYRHDADRPSGVRLDHPAGGFAYSVMGDALVGGNGDGHHLLRVRPAAEPDTVRLGDSPRPFTGELREAFALAYQAEFQRRPQSFRWGAEEYVIEGSRQLVPSYTEVYHDGNGDLWLEQWRVPLTPDAPRYMHVYSPAGTPLGRLRLPPSAARVFAFRGGQVALVETDAMGIQYVRVYDVERSGPR